MTLNALRRQMNSHLFFDRQLIEIIERIVHLRNVALLIVSRNAQLVCHYSTFMCHILRLQCAIIRRFTMNQRSLPTYLKVRRTRKATRCYIWILQHVKQLLSGTSFTPPVNLNDTLRLVKDAYLRDNPHSNSVSDEEALSAYVISFTSIREDLCGCQTDNALETEGIFLKHVLQNRIVLCPHHLNIYFENFLEKLQISKNELTDRQRALDISTLHTILQRSFFYISGNSCQNFECVDSVNQFYFALITLLTRRSTISICCRLTEQLQEQRSFGREREYSNLFNEIVEEEDEQEEEQEEEEEEEEERSERINEARSVGREE